MLIAYAPEIQDAGDFMASPIQGLGIQAMIGDNETFMMDDGEESELETSAAPNPMAAVLQFSNKKNFRPLVIVAAIIALALVLAE